MKLNKTKILEIIRHWNNGWSAYCIRKKFDVSERRVYQIVKYYEETGEIPVVGKRMGRPVKHVLEEEVKNVLKIYERYRFSASLLEPIIERDYQVHIPHNRIHQILLQAGKAKKLDKQVIRKKPVCRYERKHSLSLGHMDWHQRPNDGPWVCVLEDDASRALTSMIEVNNPTAITSVHAVQRSITQYGKYRQIITDRGSQFTCNHLGFITSSQFEQYLKKQGIEHIRCRPKHPQTNGKVEKWFDTYERHRNAFKTANQFINWYNQIRPHTALKWEILETPIQAFHRKLKK